MAAKTLSSCIVSVTWGKSNNYMPVNEPLVWDGSLRVEGGQVQNLDLLHYRFFMWVQAVEVPERLFDRNWHALLKLGEPDLAWKSAVPPGDPAGLEGIRFTVEGDASTTVTIALAPLTLEFTLGELLERDHLRFHAGGKYSGVPIDVFLGPDARPRVSRRQYLQSLRQRDGAGWALLPEDFSTAAPSCFHSIHGTRVEPGATAGASFPVEGLDADRPGDCLVRVQATAMLERFIPEADRWITLELRIGSQARTIRHCFTTRAHLPRLEDLYVSVPWRTLVREGNALSIRNGDDRCPLLVHRVFIGDERPTHRPALAKLPPLPARPVLWVGFDTNLLAPANGEIDELLRLMREEELGNYLLLRERGSRGSAEDVARWADTFVKQGVRFATNSTREENKKILRERAGALYLGEHTHEISNLVYGWGEPDPIEQRRHRTLPECQAFYLQRMSQCQMTGQAVPLHHLDYAAGVKTVITEIPGSHATLCLANARGAARAYGKDFWGVHAANHVQRCPIDEETQRRHFILLNQSWLCGARVIYDEEVALAYNHDTSYSFADAIPFGRRSLYQALYHYGAAIDLGKPLVRLGFLYGQYDCVVGGSQALPYIPPPKVWGMIGPETEAWTFGTPERGWELMGTFMPGVSLYPVKQDPRAVRQFFSGTPHGQVDLVPAIAGARALTGYELLVLPGWNTMTEEVHGALLDYVKNGGHLVLCAGQCTAHVTRDFLLEKREFNFFRGGDLRELAGVRLGAPRGVIDAIRFGSETRSAAPGLPGLDATLDGAEPLAVDQAGRPVLVEHRVGKGRVWLLLAGDYWGHPALDDFRKWLGGRLAAMHQGDLHLSGDASDVDFHCFQVGDVRRVVLLNTDWTSAGNRKEVVLHAAGFGDIPLSVREGRLTQVLLRGDVAVAFETLPVIVDDLRLDAAGASFRAGGAGRAAVRVFSQRDGAGATVDGRPAVFQNGALAMDFGETWTTRQVRIRFA